MWIASIGVMGFFLWLLAAYALGKGLDWQGFW